MQERSDRIIDSEYLAMAFEEQLQQYAQRENAEAFEQYEHSLSDQYAEMAYEELQRLDPYADKISNILDIRYD